MEQMKELEQECLGHYENTLSGLSNYPTFTKRIKEEVIENNVDEINAWRPEMQKEFYTNAD